MVVIFRSRVYSGGAYEIKVAFKSHHPLISKTNIKQLPRWSVKLAPQIFVSPWRTFHSLQRTPLYLPSEV